MPAVSAHAITLRPLARTPGDLAALQAVLEAAPTYARLTSGAAPDIDSAASVLEALPPGKSAQDKFVFGVFAGEACVGCVDLIRGYPDERTAMLGLLLIAEPQHGRGIGKAAYALVEAVVRAWPQAERVRIGVVEANDRVLPFWRALGFQPTGAVKPYASGSVTSRVIVLERVLERAA